MATHPIRSVLRGANFWLLLGVVSSCDGEAGQQAPGVGEVVERDSVGVTIVETPGAIARAPIGWRVDEEPNLQIGSVAGDGPDGFDNVEGNIVGLSDGRIVVLDRSHHELRFFDGEGRFLNRAGRRGEGPGEFQGYPYLFPHPSSDSVIVVDNQLRRVTFFSSDGEGYRVTPREPASELVMGAPRGVLGSKILRAWTLGSSSYEKGMHPSTVGLHLGNLETGDDEIIVQFDLPRYIDMDESHTSLRQVYVPFHVRPFARWGSSTFFVVGGDQPEVREFDMDGRLVRIMRLAEIPRPVTSDDLDPFISAHSQLHGVAESEVRRVYARMELPEFWPTFQDVRVDPLGWVWAELFRLPQDETKRWMVFDAEGMARGTLELPQDLYLGYIGVDYVLSSWWDDLGVEYVQRYRIERGG